MKLAVVICLIALLLLSVVAWVIKPEVGEKGKTLIVWCTDDNPARREQIDLFKKLNPNYDLLLDPGNYSHDKIIVQSIAGVGPDVFDSFGAPTLDMLAKADIIWDITDEFKKAGIDPAAITWEVSHDSFIRNGRIYGFPTNAGVRVVLFNKDCFDKQGIPYPQGPWKWDQMVKLAQKLTIRDEKGRVKQYGLMVGWGHREQFIRQWGGSIYTPDGTRCIVDSPECIAATQFMHDLIYKYRVTPSPVEESAISSKGGWGAGEINIFGSGRVAMVIGDRWWLCRLRDNKDLRLGVVECPYEKKKIYIGGARVTLINKNSPRKRDALAFIFYLASKEYNMLLNHQADWLSPVKEYCFTDEYLHDPDYPNETYNKVYRDVMKYGTSPQFSKFANASAVYRIVAKQLDLVKNNEKTAEAAMKTIAVKVNEEIQKTISKDPALRAEYEKLTKGKSR